MPTLVDDPNDMTNQYNTGLTDAEESQFQSWIEQQSDQKGRDVHNDLYDYDLRGDWLAGAQRDPGTDHGSDFYKKPNHPTFSTGSKYNGADGEEGGVWSKKSDGSWAFMPGSSNLKYHSADELRDYWKQVEVDPLVAKGQTPNELVLTPEGQ